MPSKSPLALALAAGASLVSAHGYVSLITVGGTEYEGYNPSSAPYENPAVARIAWSNGATDLGYVAPDAYASGDIICHKSAENAALTAPITAGDVVSLQWNTWPDSHKGPVITYLANCNGNCSSVDKTTLEFFKIAEGGLIDDTTEPGTWESDELIANNYTSSVTIPSTLAAGNYVLRHEIIALHSAENSDGAQNYPQCVNLEVTGSGTVAPDGTLGESLYTETDPGILVNIYTTLTTYDIPGPTLAFDDSGSAATATAAAGTTTTAAASSSAAAATTSAASTSSAAAVSSEAAATTSTAATSAAAVATTSTSTSAAATKTASSCKKRRHARQLKN